MLGRRVVPGKAGRPKEHDAAPEVATTRLNTAFELHQ